MSVNTGSEDFLIIEDVQRTILFNEMSRSFLKRRGSATVFLKNAMRGPMKNAVMMVPIPGMTPRRVPVGVQIRSETTRMKEKPRA